MMKNILWSVSLLLFFGSASPAVSQGYLHASGYYIHDSNDQPIILRGIGLGGWLVPEGYMLGTNSPYDSPTGFVNAVASLIGDQKALEFMDVYRLSYVKRRDIDSVAKWGFNSVRLPMHWSLLSPAQGVYDDHGFATIDSLLSWCEANHLYLILDLHCAVGGQNSGNISDYQGYPSLWESPEYQQWTAELWKEIARRYADKQWIGGYDLLNETTWSFPSGNNTPLRDLFVRITDSIRTVDRNHMIFAEGNSWATDFSGLAPAWDANMAWSFHKYWSSNSDPGSIQTYLNLRGNTNRPLWMGESGENSNQWFADAVAMFEKYNIGWSWWTLKKTESISCPLSAARAPDYTVLLNYWNNGGTKPSAAFAESALYQEAALLDAGQCTFHPDFIDALFRVPFTTDRRPFAANLIPGTIHAVDYDMGRVGIAYNDADYQNTGGSSYNTGWSYRNDGVDIERCTDASSNGYNVGWTGAGESLSFTVQVQTGGLYRIKVRVSSGASGGTAKLNWDGIDLSPALSIPGTGGWQAWTTLTLGDYQLTAGTHDLKFNCVTGGYNVGRMEFSLLATGVEDETDVPLAFSLQQNYPNPFNPSTRIKYTVGGTGETGARGWGLGASKTSLIVYDLLGREVAVLVNERKAPGSYELSFDARGLSSGIYIYRLTAGSYIQTRTMVLLK
jgi:endoglucanase